MLNDYISNCWNGKEKLWRVFWIWFVLVLSFSAVILIGVVKYFYLGRYIDEWLHYVLIVLFVYGPWVLASIWRCAFNVERRLWGYLARGWVVVFSIASVVLFSSPFWIPWLYGVGY